MTTQDFKKRLDITGLTQVGGSQINQNLETALPADDKGIIINTTDSAIDTPVVPNPNTELEGVTPTHWINYRWHRHPHADDGAEARVKKYVWNANKVADETLLKWENEDDLANEALEDAAEALEAAQEANTLATNANTLATSAQTAAAESLTAAQSAQELADINNTSINTVLIPAINTNGTTLQNHENRLDVLESTPPTVANLGLQNSVKDTAFLKDVKVAGTNGGTFTQDAWQTRTLNLLNKTGTDAWIVLNGDFSFDLIAGSYIIEAEAPGVNIEFHQARLYNVTGTVSSSTGSSEYSSTTAVEITKSKINAIVTITETTKFRIEHYCTRTQASNGFGVASNIPASSEVYTQVKISRLAS